MQLCYLQQKPNISQRIFQMLHIIISLPNVFVLLGHYHYSTGRGVFQYIFLIFERFSAPDTARIAAFHSEDLGEQPQTRTAAFTRLFFFFLAAFIIGRCLAITSGPGNTTAHRRGGASAPPGPPRSGPGASPALPPIREMCTRKMGGQAPYGHVGGRGPGPPFLRRFIFWHDIAKKRPLLRVVSYGIKGPPKCKAA